MAPATGIVFRAKGQHRWSVGSSVTLILTIIPQEGLKAKVFVANKDIGFVKTGQTARVRIDAFPSRDMESLRQK